MLVALVLAVSGPLGAEMLPASHPVIALDSHTAAKLLIHVAKPDYPAVAKVNFIQGSVKLQITVNTEGKVIAAHVVEGEPLLAAAAIEAVRKWLYHPYHFRDGVAPFSTHVSVEFLLHHHKFGRRVPQNPDADLERQIRPPEAIVPPDQNSASAGVQFRVLVDAKGQLLDAAALEAKGSNVSVARENLRCWKFRPARWGALAVPWYIVVKVPIQHTLAEKSAFSASH